MKLSVAETANKEKGGKQRTTMTNRYEFFIF